MIFPLQTIRKKAGAGWWIKDLTSYRQTGRIIWFIILKTEENDWFWNRLCLKWQPVFTFAPVCHIIFGEEG